MATVNPNNGERLIGESRSPSSPSVAALLRGLFDDAGALARTEIELVRTETRANLRSAQHAVGAMATGAAVLHAGLLALVACAVIALDRYMERWLAALIVGGALTVIGLIMMLSAKRKISADLLKPEHTLNTLQTTEKFARHESSRAMEKWQ